MWYITTPLLVSTALKSITVVAEPLCNPASSSLQLIGEPLSEIIPIGIKTSSEIASVPFLVPSPSSLKLTLLEKILEQATKPVTYLQPEAALTPSITTLKLSVLDRVPEITKLFVALCKKHHFFSGKPESSLYNVDTEFLTKFCEKLIIQNTMLPETKTLLMSFLAQDDLLAILTIFLAA